MRFKLKLCLALGCFLSDLEPVSQEELTIWAAFFQIEPWGDERADVRSAIVAATTAGLSNCWSKKPRKFRTQDFIPKFERTRQTPEQMKRILAGHG